MSSRVMEFATIEDLFNFAEGIEQASKRLYEAMPIEIVSILQVGHHYVLIEELCGKHVFIFGEIIPPVDDDGTPIPIATYRRYVRAFSILCPDGELESVCVAHMMPISEQAMAMACAAHWQVAPCVVEAMVDDRLREVGSSLVEAAAHMEGVD